MVKTLEDYLERMYNLFPEVPQDEIKDIMKKGMSEMVHLCMEGIDYAVDYKEPGASFMIASNTKNSGRPLKTKRRDIFLNARKQKKAIMEEEGCSFYDASIIYKSRKKCQEETSQLDMPSEI